MIEKQKNLIRGQVVISKKGRDKGGFFVVTGTEGEYAMLVDGKLRPLDRPKKKKHLHIQPTNHIDYKLKEIMDNNGYMNDSDVRKAILGYTGGEV
jgi:ribosomal protein L14E/L6E/L27E